MTLNKNLKNNRQSGFTIVELLIVIIVIGILAALVIVSYNGVQQRARDAERETDIRAIAQAAELYNAENNAYPARANVNANYATEMNLDQDALVGPRAATSTTALAAAATNAAGSETYRYRGFGCTGTGAAAVCVGFEVSAALESGTTETKNGGDVTGTAES